MKNKQMTFRIQNNTDSIDIDQKCLGLNSWVPGDSLNLLNSNRGLHIQIRHNRDKQTFEAACKLQKLLSAAPEMLETLKCLASSTAVLNHLDADDNLRLCELISKAGGAL